MIGATIDESSRRNQHELENQTQSLEQKLLHEKTNPPQSNDS
jgi:hypothetical protein